VKGSGGKKMREGKTTPVETEKKCGTKNKRDRLRKPAGAKEKE